MHDGCAEVVDSYRDICGDPPLVAGGEGELSHPCHLGDVGEEHDQEPGLLHILKLGAHITRQKNYVAPTKVWHILFVIDVSHMSHNNIGFLSHVIFSTIKKVKLIHNKHNQSIKNVKRQDRRL